MGMNAASIKRSVFPDRYAIQDKGKIIDAKENRLARKPGLIRMLMISKISDRAKMSEAMKTIRLMLKEKTVVKDKMLR